MDGQCFICNIPGVVCSVCKQVAFCTSHSRAHSRKASCFPFNIGQNERVGRHFIATRDIQPTELILLEKPASMGPYTRSLPQCLGCSWQGPLKHLCRGCNYPLCTASCEEGPHEVECNILKQQGFKAKVKKRDEESPLYAPISVIRLINLRSSNSEVYKQLMQMEHHTEQRRQVDPQLWYYHQKHVVKFIKQVCRIDISEKEIYQVIGAMFTNFVDIELPSGYGRANGFYPTYALMNHRCRSNTVTLKFTDQRLEIRAKVFIRRGEEISTQYLQPLKPTFRRQPLLRAKWFFTCTCELCLDPTEGGSFISALLCKKDRCGGSVVPVLPTEGESEWQCRVCRAEIPLQLVIQIISTLAYQIDNPLVGHDPVLYFEKLIAIYSKLLHPNHYLNYQMKERLAILYGNIPAYPLHSLPRPQVDRKIQVCEDTLHVLDIVDPGVSALKTKLLGELGKTMLSRARLDLDNKILSREKYETVISKINKLQQDANFCTDVLNNNK